MEDYTKDNEIEEIENTEEKEDIEKTSLSTKVKAGFKKYGKTIAIAAVGLAGFVGYAIGKSLSKKSESEDSDNSEDVVEVEDYTVNETNEQ